MAGVYIHIPFCKQACHYCDFHFSTSLRQKDQLLKALEKEIELRQNELKSDLKTIYFGGGTPSLLKASELKSILDKIRNFYALEAKPEITLEANPDDLNSKKLQELKSIGINRLSIGIQSLNDKSLRWMNRAHNAIEARKSIQEAQGAGFDNISIDLIYGLPGLSSNEWREELNDVLKFKIQHISAYCLTVEDNTALGHWVKKGKEKPIDEDAAQSQFQIMIEQLNAAGFDHYEVSNFGRPDYYSKHNTSYWQGIPYLGIGPSAHSFSGTERSWNIANNARYVQSISSGELPVTRENLSKEDRINEYLMTGLRTKWGIDLDKLKTEHNYNLEEENKEVVQKILSEGRATLIGNRLTLTKKGLFMADGIASDFFILKHDS